MSEANREKPEILNKCKDAAAGTLCMNLVEGG